MRAVLLLADWADAINGKLYIQGGGWSQVHLNPNGTINFGFACKLFVGWDEANMKHKVAFVIRDPDGKVLEPVPGEQFRIESTLEVGRPPGVLRGSEIDAPLAMNIGGLPIAPGRYRLEVEVNDAPLDAAIFDVHESGGRQ